MVVGEGFLAGFWGGGLRLRLRFSEGKGGGGEGEGRLDGKTGNMRCWVTIPSN